MQNAARRLLHSGLVLALAIVALLGPDAAASDSVSIGPGVTVHGATSAELSLVRWALGRYGSAGLILPPLQIYFHDDVSGCNGHTGLYTSVGRVDLCPGLLINAVTKNTILHEMGHGWSEVGLTGEQRARFLYLRQVDNWESYAEKWNERGWEQAAEILAWGVGERIIIPPLPLNHDDQLVGAYQLMTGKLPPSR